MRPDATSRPASMLKPSPLRRWFLVGAAAFLCCCMHPGRAASLSPLEQLMVLTGVLDHAPASMQAVTADLRAKYPEVPPALWDNYAARINDHASLLRLYAPIYRRHVSNADARALADFFRSPLGSRYLAALAQITRDTDSAAKAWAVSVANDLLREQDPPAAALQAPQPGQARAVRELIRVSGARARARSICAEIISRLRDSNVDEALIRRAQRRLSSGDALMESWVPAYARHLTPDDTRAMIGFFRSPVGRRWVGALPAIQAQCLLAASSFAQDASREAVREVLGPLPQWRLMHPVQAPPGAGPPNPPGPAPAH